MPRAWSERRRRHLQRSRAKGRGGQAPAAFQSCAVSRTYEASRGGRPSNLVVSLTCRGSVGKERFCCNRAVTIRSSSLRPASRLRHYHSVLRAEQAAATRARVIDAAAELFAHHGFARTTLPLTASAANVSVETVRSQGAKRSLLGAAVRRLSFGREDDEIVLEASEAGALRVAKTPRQFARAAAELMGQLNGSTYGLWRAFRSAAADDPTWHGNLRSSKPRSGPTSPRSWPHPHSGHGSGTTPVSTTWQPTCGSW